MRTRIRHIAILLTALFAVTLMPFNAFHHHEEHEHAAALLGHDAEHSCALDEHFCQEEFTGSCGHTEHISPVHIKCFSCQFHFIKAFEHSAICITFLQQSTGYSYITCSGHLISARPGAVHNKGPPAAAAPVFS